MSKRWLLYFLCGWAILFVTFWFNGINSLDPDFGWHLKIGQIMISQGIPRTDPFSYTMPTFPWVDHGRLSDVTIARLYPKIGIPGLAAILALAATGALALVIPVSLWGMALVPLLLGTGVFVARFGVRPQVEDWLFTAVCLRICNDGNLWKKWKWLVPIIFIIWANWHGGWLMGLIIIGVRVASGWWPARKFNLKDMGVLVFSVLFTAASPYGFRLWQEIWLTVTDTNLRWGIVEWQPFFMKTEMGYWLLTALFFALYKIYGKVLSGWRVILTVILLLGSMSSLRNVPFYILAVVPLTAELIKQAYDEVKANPAVLFRARIFYAILATVAGVLFFVEAGVSTWKLAKNGGIIYPVKATEYLSMHLIEGRLFTNYAWGGYLIWKLPNEKVFTDGRMPSWRRIPPAGESAWAFKDYQKIANTGDYKTLFGKYGIKTVLWPKGDILGNAQKPAINIPSPGWWKWVVAKLGGKKQKYFIEEITKDGWKKIYEDGVSVIYVSPPNTN